MALPFFLSACNDDKKADKDMKKHLKGTPEQQENDKKFFKGLDELKGVSKEKAIPERR